MKEGIKPEEGYAKYDKFDFFSKALWSNAQIAKRVRPQITLKLFRQLIVENDNSVANIPRMLATALSKTIQVIFGGNATEFISTQKIANG